MKTIREWLESIDLGQYADQFESNDIDLSLLPQVDDAILKDVGVKSAGHRIRIKSAIAALTKANESSPGPTATAVYSPAALSGERRHATVMFSDLVGYTALNERRDPEEVKAFMARVKSEAVRIVESHGGVVNQFVGDEVLALFGIPVSYKDDPVRCVRAALELHEVVREMALEVEASLGQSVRFHSGISSGLVVTDYSDDRDGRTGVTGDTINVAARLKSLAEEDEILICPETKRALGTKFDLRALTRTTLKGKQRPIAPYLVLGESSRVNSFDIPFVGRRAELQQLESAITNCLETSAGQTIIVRGEPGIGKSRLVREAQRVAESAGCGCHDAEVVDFGSSSSVDPIRTLVRSLLNVDKDAPRDVRATTANALMDTGRLDASYAPFLFDLLDLPQTGEWRAKYDAMDNEYRKEQSKETVVKIARVASENEPKFLLVEDVHWAEPGAVAFLAALAEAATAQPVLLVMTTRIAGDPFDAEWKRSVGGGVVSTLDLNPLPYADASRLASSFGEVDPEAIERCLERAGGNPLFLEQLLLNWERSDTSNVPGSVQSAVLARLDQLEAADKLFLQAASVLGRRFDANAACHVLGKEVQQFESILAQGLIAKDESGYLFTHALVRDGVYESLLHSARRTYHERAAEWYRERNAILHAEHLEACGSSKAAHAFLAAARDEAKRLHLDRALQLVDRGERLAVAEELFEFLLEKGKLQREVGALKDSIVSYERAADAARSEFERCSSLLGMAEVMRLSDDFDRCLSVLSEVQPIVDLSGDRKAHAQMHFLRGCIYFGIGRPSKSLSEFGLARSAALKTKLPELELRSLSGMADGYFIVGKVREGYKFLQQCIRGARRHGLYRIEAANRVAKGWSQQYFDGAERALEEMELGLRQSEEAGLWRSAWFGKCMAVGLLVNLCRLDEAEVRLCNLEVELTRLESPRLIALTYIYGAIVMSYMSQRESAHEYANRALEMLAATSGAHLKAATYGIVASTASSWATARTAIESGEQCLANGAVFNDHHELRRFSIDAALRFDQWDDAVIFANRLDELNKSENLPWIEFFVRRGRALAAYGKNARTAELLSEVGDIIKLGEHMGLIMALPELRMASEKLRG